MPSKRGSIFSSERLEKILKHNLSSAQVEQYRLVGKTNPNLTESQNETNQYPKTTSKEKHGFPLPIKNEDEYRISLRRIYDNTDSEYITFNLEYLLQTGGYVLSQAIKLGVALGIAYIGLHAINSPEIREMGYNLISPIFSALSDMTSNNSQINIQEIKPPTPIP